ncbi:MAG: hypothetical protein HY046_06220 [Acidobacteria bacterium]|nr:hypothetical protein [Acidobacteriota bacterium]
MKVLFWENERGTLPYDLLVAGIVAFVFLSPRAWFNDQPQPGQVVHTSHVLMMGEDPAERTRTYRIDAGLLAAPQGPQQLERRAHDLLSRSVDELKSMNFQIVRIDPVLDESNAITHYDVRVRQ